MSEVRPTVSADLVATVIEAAPDRVRRRLDRSPTQADQWQWQAAAERWMIDTGGETVHLPHGQITAIEQLSCTCLLSPRCFHVLACLTVLEVATVDVPPDQPAEEASSTEASASETQPELITPSDKQRQAAEQLAGSVAQLLQVGVANAGVVVQSSLLRAIHRGRAAGLHRAAAVAMRIAAGVTQVRGRSAQADPLQLSADMADLLETTRQIIAAEQVAHYWLGTTRRQQFAVRPRRLHGMFAEPLVTRSGYAGAVVYFQGDDNQVYSASAVRPGEAQLARDAYLGGIEIGSLIQPGKELARGLYLGSELTASSEGRLGRGKNIRIVQQGTSSWSTAPIAQRFESPLHEQYQTIYERALLPAEARPAAWDVVFFSCTVLGALGPELLAETTQGQIVRLAIESEHEALYFRTNLHLLSHAPGLALRVIGRLNRQQPEIVFPLAIAAAESSESEAQQPQLDLPASFAGSVNLGFDKLQRKHLLHAQAAPQVLGGQVVESNDDPLAAFARRLIGTMLAGTSSQRQTRQSTTTLEAQRLQQHGFATGAALLETLTGVQASSGNRADDLFLAASIYLRKCRNELAKSRASIDN